ncbi:MAG: TIGR02281 family clan AA aspartic protease [Thioalkalispiraceae bacterium]|jgi:aspartyl protease family protein
MAQEKKHWDSHHNIKLAIWIGFWALLLSMVVLLFEGILESERNPNTNPETAFSDGAREVVLKRNRYGHYNVTGYINGEEVEFLVDTGATDISVPQHIAEQIGLQRLYEVRFDTANGTAMGYATRLASVQIGNIQLQELSASINPNVDDSTVLLGMSFLKKIEFTQRGDTLILRQYEY